MLSSLLSEIRLLRRDGHLDINPRNSNRYRVLLREPDGTQTAYYFSAPIYGTTSRRLVSLRFRESGSGYLFTGSSARVTVADDKIRLQDEEAALTVSFGRETDFIPHGNGLCTDGIELTPSLNGVAVRARCTGGEGITLSLETDRPFWQVRANSKYVALMSGDFRPFMTVSAIGGIGSEGQVVCPAAVTYEKLDDQRYMVTISPVSPLCGAVLFEINLYEEKLIQDTTVESRRSDENNAFGGTAFLGSSETFGEQWLYAKWEYSRMAEMRERELRRVTLHLPRYNSREAPLTAHRVAQRFCSFGSSWDNKMPIAEAVADSCLTPRYHHLDITHLMADGQDRRLRESEGIILRTRVKDDGFTVVATGDNYTTPQILEINFRSSI